MQKTKLLIFFSLIVIFSLSLLPLSSAIPVTISQHPYSPDSSSYHFSAPHPSSTGEFSYVGQTFQVTATGYVHAITIYLKAYGSLINTENLQFGMKICNLTSDDDANSYFDTDIETSTTTYSSNDISSTAWTSYTFSFNGTTLFTNGEVRGFYIYGISADYHDGSNYISVGDVSTTFTGRIGLYYLSTQTYGSSGLDLCYYVVGETELGATPTPAPSPTATPAPGTTPPPELTTIWATVSNLIQLLVPLLVVVLPAFFGYKYAGAWGFLAGINIGAILAYVVLGATTFPLWGIVVILILDALLLFGKVGFHS